jgi:hypothetical protein
VFSTVYRAVPSDDGTISSWSTETSLPASTYGLAAAVANGYLYASGGNNGSETLDDIWYASVNASGALSSWGTASTSLSGPRVFHRLVAWDGALYQVGGREDDLEYYATRSAVVYRLPLRTSTSSTYAYDSAYTCLVDLGADVEVVAIEWTDTAVSDGLVGLSYRLASSATANAGSWSDLGTGGAGYVFETGRYVQIRAMLSSNAATATSLDDITVLWRR